jgi:phosphomannomutase
VIDERGAFLHPNKILSLLYYFLLKYKHWKGPIVRNLSTTHMLDRIAEAFGEKCYEVPVGFKYISARMKETNAIMGGESSGGFTVRGHIMGKDGIYIAALLVEMMAVTRKKLSELDSEISALYGEAVMTDYSATFPAEMKGEIEDLLLVKKSLPKFPFETEKTSYADGCKVYFKNGGWLTARFSGTEPLLRVLCEMENRKSALEAQNIMAEFLGF